MPLYPGRPHFPALTEQTPPTLYYPCRHLVCWGEANASSLLTRSTTQNYVASCIPISPSAPSMEGEAARASMSVLGKKRAGPWFSSLSSFLCSLGVSRLLLRLSSTLHTSQGDKGKDELSSAVDVHLKVSSAPQTTQVHGVWHRGKINRFN